LSISERVDFQPLLIRKNARIKKIKINSNVMLHPIDTVGRLYQMDFPLIPSEVAIRLNFYGYTISTASPRTCRIAAEEPALTDLILLAFALLQLAHRFTSVRCGVWLLSAHSGSRSSSFVSTRPRSRNTLLLSPRRRLRPLRSNFEIG
jgi:hypothetical protein